MLGLNYNISNPNFKQNNSGKLFNSSGYSADQFLIDLKKEEEKRIKGDFFSRNFGSLTAVYSATGITLLGEIAFLLKIRQFKKNKLTNSVSKNFKNKSLLMLISSAIAGITVGGLIQHWQNKIINKKNPLVQNALNEYGNDTSAKLAENNMRRMTIAAQYNSLNGVIDINKNYLNDPIGKRMIKKFIKHELQHARQFEMIAGLENGLQKLNYASVYNLANYIKKNPIAREQIESVINDINNDTTGVYDNAKIYISGAEVNFKDYVKTLEIFINNEDVKPEDIPMLLDVDHYKKALVKRGPLSEKEKIKAEEYYQAMLKYPILTGLNLVNPFSGYKSNILEKEARKASRSKTGKID